MGFVDLILAKNGVKPSGNRSRRFGDIRHYVCDKNLALANFLIAAYNDTYFVRGLHTIPNVSFSHSDFMDE